MRSKIGTLWPAKRDFSSTDTDAAAHLRASDLFTLIDLADNAITNQKFLDWKQAPNEGHFPLNTIDQALGAIAAAAPTLGEFSGVVSASHSQHGSGSIGDGTTSTPDIASSVTVSPGFTGTGSVARPVPNRTIDDGSTLELSHAYSGTISFAGSTGTLIIDHSSSFSGKITGQLAIGNIIDLPDITAGANATILFSGNNSPGTLTVSDGTHTANIALDGIYSLANFTVSSDGHGGTFVIDPPLAQVAYSLRQIDGGSNYFAQFSNSLPTDPSFFPVGAWFEGVYSQQDVNLDKAAGLNLYVGMNANSNFSLVQSNGMYLIGQQDELKTNPTVLGNTSTTGWLLYDEIDLSLGAGGYTTQNNIIASLPNDGRFTYNNFSKGVQFWETNAEAGRYVNGVDVASADIYWFTDPNFSMDGSEVISWLNNGNPLSPSQIRLAANYGYSIDHLRAVDATDGVTHPIWGFVELGWPFTETAAQGGSAITPDEIKAAVWQEIIAGARGIVYFNHSFGGPEPTFNVLRDPYYAAELAAVTQTDALIKQLAPVLNSPFDDAFVTVNSSVRAMSKYYNGEHYVFAGSTVNGASTSPDTFTLAGITSGTADVVGENRSITITNGKFSDTFADGNAIHIYHIVAGGTQTTPGAPTIGSFSTDSNVAGDGITNDNTIALTGTAPAGSTVKVLDGTALLGTVTASSSGAWSFTTAARADGDHSFTATATDSAGNTSAASAALSVTVDTQAPAAPTISSFSTDTGTVGDGITSDNTLALTGTAATNSTVKIFDGTSQIGTATANSSGTWSYTTAALPDGAHSLTAKAMDTAGNTSAASAALAVTVNTQGSTMPTITKFSTDSGIVGDGITNDNTPTLTGTAPANSTVQVNDGSTLLGTTTADSSGAWTYTTGPLSNGAHQITATAPTSSGTTSSSFPDASTTGVTPGASLTSVGGFTSSSSGQIITGLDVNGTITINQAGVTVRNCRAENIIINAANVTIENCDVVGGDWNSGIVIHADGATIRGCDISGVENGIWLEGNGCLIQDNYLHDLAAPGNPDPHYDGLQIPGDTSHVSNNLITHNNFDLPSTTTSSCITMKDATNIDIANNRLNGGTYSIYFEGATTGSDVTNNLFLAHQFGFYAGTADSAQTFSGNIFGGTTTTTTTTTTTSTTSAALSITIDTQAPSAPAISSFSTDSGTVGDRITNDNTLTLTGTAAANSTVKVFDGASLLGSAVANGSGTWSYTTATLSNGAHSLTATATDAAGNTSANSSAFAVTVDTVAPAAPILTGDSISGTDRVTLTGTAEADSTIKVFEGATQLGTAATNSNGAWTFTTAPLGAGSHDFTATATDSAGNTSALSDLLDPIIGTAIESNGATDLTVVAKHDYLLDSAGSGPSLKVSGMDYVAGQFGAWTAIGAEKTASGYEVAWKVNGADTYTVWNVDSQGNFIAHAIGFVSGSAPLLQSFEASFVQDLNGDGQIGVSKTVVESNGATDLTAMTNHDYLFDSNGSGPSLKASGMDYVAGQFGAWTPIGAEKTASGYEVAWKVDGADMYTVWNVDSQGNFIAHAIGFVSGSDPALQSFETSLVQDLNGDGKIGTSNIVNGTSGNNTLTSSSANEVFFGHGGNDTFVFTGITGKDVVADFQPNNDVLQLSHNVFANFAAVLAHAAQVGSDVTITVDASNSVTLHNTTLSQLTNNNIHIV